MLVRIFSPALLASFLRALTELTAKRLKGDPSATIRVTIIINHRRVPCAQEAHSFAQASLVGLFRTERVGMPLGFHPALYRSGLIGALRSFSQHPLWSSVCSSAMGNPSPSPDRAREGGREGRQAGRHAGRRADLVLGKQQVLRISIHYMDLIFRAVKDRFTYASCFQGPPFYTLPLESGNSTSDGIYRVAHG